ncbi:MAG: penicillin-binding protein activator [Prevotella sp.]|nr:penicillin-binding protein activator [Prevotella sp.]
MKKKSIIWLVILLAIIVSFWALQKKCSAKGDDTIKIGVIMPQTGFLASPGHNVINGINLFVDNYNAHNQNKKIELIIEDSGSDPKVGVSAINKLINADHVKIIIGDIGSPIYLAMAPIAERNKVVMISPGASNPKVREAGDYIFRIYTSDEFDGKVMANYLCGRKNVRRVALLHFNNDYGIGLSNAFKNEFAKLNGSLALDYSFDENSLDFKESIIRLKNAKVDDVYFIGSPKQDAAFLRQIKESNTVINVYGVLSFEDSEFLQIAKNTFDHVEYTTPFFDLNSEDVKMQEFKKNYSEKYSSVPDLNSALGYDVVNVLAIALHNCDYKVEYLKDEIYNIKDFDGLTGKTSFDEKGDVMKDVMIKEVMGDGSQRLIEVFQLNN